MYSLDLDGTYIFSQVCLLHYFLYMYALYYLTVCIVMTSNWSHSFKMKLFDIARIACYILLPTCYRAVGAASSGNDDKIHTDASTLSLSKASVYPLSCTDYKGMALIRYELYAQSHSSTQCSAQPLGTYVTSLHRFMHAYWNFQALTLGNQFTLPSDAAYLTYVRFTSCQRIQ